jgi:hypothetical protein
MTAPAGARHAVEATPHRPGFSAELAVVLSLVAPAVRGATSALWRSGPPPERYRAYLRAMHALIRASVPLLERAAACCERLGPDDPVAGPLRRYLLLHADEERGHDDWLLADLAAAGGDPAALTAALPPAAVAAMAGAQYYWIEHHHPVTLLGYIAVLEGNAPAPSLADRLADRTGLPPAAFRTVRDHAALDTGHVADLLDLVDGLPLRPAHRRAVRLSALHTARELAGLFRALAVPGVPPVPPFLPDPSVPPVPSGGTA